MITKNSDGIEVNGHVGSWYVIDAISYRGERLFLLESEIYGEDAASVIVTADNKIVLEDVHNGFDDLFELWDDRKFVSLYRIIRCYGGPEEGGWWYNAFELMESVPIDKVSDATDLRNSLQVKYMDVGDIYSVNGGMKYMAIFECEEGETVTKVKPHYE